LDLRAPFWVRPLHCFVPRLERPANNRVVTCSVFPSTCRQPEQDETRRNVDCHGIGGSRENVGRDGVTLLASDTITLLVRATG
jgi:hypothetical protein